MENPYLGQELENNDRCDTLLRYIRDLEEYKKLFESLRRGHFYGAGQDGYLYDIKIPWDDPFKDAEIVYVKTINFADDKQ